MPATATIARLEKELEHLETIDLPAARTAVAVAQGVGDITENTDVAIALGELVRVRNRIKQIKDVIANPTAQAVVPAGVIGIGRIVELRFDDDDPETYLFGNVEDRHPLYTTMTEASPVGQTICGRVAGDTIKMELAGTTQAITIISVRDE
jgi:transcription elongation factor GreA